MPLLPPRAASISLTPVAPAARASLPVAEAPRVVTPSLPHLAPVGPPPPAPAPAPMPRTVVAPAPAPMPRKETPMPSNVVNLNTAAVRRLASTLSSSAPAPRVMLGAAATRAPAAPTFAPSSPLTLAPMAFGGGGGGDADAGASSTGADAPSDAPPATTLAKVQAFVTDNKTAFAIAGGVAAVGLAATLWFALRKG
jgi:hypothetical protein